MIIFDWLALWFRSGKNISIKKINVEIIIANNKFESGYKNTRTFEASWIRHMEHLGQY